MPSYIEEPEAAACKWVSIREQNREKLAGSRHTPRIEPLIVILVS
jgi:hypothetical protein